MNIPGIARQGDTWEWQDFPQLDPLGNSMTSNGFTLSYVIAGGVKLGPIAGTPNGTGWIFSVAPSITETAVPGVYYWQAYTNDNNGNRYTVGDGQITVTPDLTAQAAGTENRSIAKQIIDAVNAEIQARIAGHAVEEYSIAGRSLRKETMAALMDIRAEYTEIYRNEVRRARMRQGLGDPGSRFTIFRRPDSGQYGGSY